jgi:hypothetical protein
MIMTRSGENPSVANNTAKTGTITSPPPTPKSPAIKPEAVPNKMLAIKMTVT